MNNLMSVKFLAKNENVIFARGVAASFLVNLKVDVGFINEIKTAISEAVTNARGNGYGSDESKIVELKMSYDDETVTMEVIDMGIGIEDISKAKEPLYSTKIDEERAGLGFTIMEVFTDQLIVSSTVNQGTSVKMIKKYYEQL